MGAKVTKKDKLISNTIAIVLIAISTILFLIPLILVISVSFTSEAAINNDGFNLIPTEFTTQAYEAVFAEPSVIIQAYIITAAQAFLGMVAAVFVTALAAYPLSRKDFKPRKVLMFYFLFTMLFNGGMIAMYLLNTQTLGLQNNFLVYILPSLINVWYLIIMKTFFAELPLELIESAKIDGAKEFRIFAQIIIPLSKPVIATVALLLLLDKWNDWMTSMLYMQSEPSMYTLQYLLQRILNQIEFVRAMAGLALNIDPSQYADLPGENFRFAMCVVAAGPMLFIFPFFQKYFVRGLTVGSVKG